MFIYNYLFSNIKSIDSEEIDWVKTQLQPLSDSMERKLQPAINKIHESHPVKELIKLSFKPLANFERIESGVRMASKGTQDKACLMVNEKTVSRMGEKDIEYLIGHEWGHILKEHRIKREVSIRLIKYGCWSTVVAFIATRIFSPQLPISLRIIHSGIAIAVAYVIPKIATRHYINSEEREAHQFSIQKMGLDAHGEQMLMNRIGRFHHH